MERYKINKNGYKFDRYLFQFVMWSIILFISFVAYHYNFNMNYYKCDMGLDNTKECKNPFYTPVDWENNEYLPSGEYGFKPTPLFNSVVPVALISVLLVFVLNHFIYNKGKGLVDTDINEDGELVIK